MNRIGFWMLATTMGLATACGADANNGSFDANGGTNGSYESSGTNGATNGASYANTNGDFNGLTNGGTNGGGLDDTQNGENYQEWEENDWVSTGDEATSTFSIDVDNASYTLARNDLQNGRLPHPDGVRVEEYVNFFDYGYPQPADDVPFSINMEIAPSPFGDYHLHEEPHSPEEAHPIPEGELHLMRIGLQGRDVDVASMKPTNLVFLIDTSGSMNDPQKLPLVQETLQSLVDHLRPDDTIGIVTYAGNAGVVLDPTPVSDASTIQDAIDRLNAGGSTNGEAGIVTAYELAEQAKVDGGNNRVIIATDGDFNVGKRGDDLVQVIRDYRERQISLTAVGYGRGNYNDATMEALARDGNGNYFYIDSADEAQRIFGTELPSTLEVIAADVKIQVEFATDTVVRYRLVGYENRVLDNEDFDDDTKDAGEIGPGHTVTALYELEIDPDADSQTGLLAEVRLRHKAQYGEASELQEQGIKLSQVQSSIDDATDGTKFAAAVAEFAEILRDSKHSADARFDDVKALAESSHGGDDAKLEFIELVDAASTLWQ